MQPRRNEMLAWWPNLELQAILLQIFIMINEGVAFPTLNFTNSWKYFDLSIITSHVSPRLHLPYNDTQSFLYSFLGSTSHETLF